MSFSILWDDGDEIVGVCVPLRASMIMRPRCVDDRVPKTPVMAASLTAHHSWSAVQSDRNGYRGQRVRLDFSAVDFKIYEPFPVFCRFSAGIIAGWGGALRPAS